MCCEKCEHEGKAKTIHFERCGRWETRVFCDHTYKRARLNKTQLGHISAAEARKTTVKGRRVKRVFAGPKQSYSADMDKFLLVNYSNNRAHRGQGVMRDLCALFDAKFGTTGTRPNQLIGRWCRLMKLEEARILSQPRGVPSLPVLKFMRDAGAGARAPCAN